MVIFIFGAVGDAAMSGSGGYSGAEVVVVRDMGAELVVVGEITAVVGEGFVSE